MKTVYAKTLSGDCYTIEDAPDTIVDLINRLHEILPEPKPETIDMKLFREEDLDSNEPGPVQDGDFFHFLVLESDFYVELDQVGVSESVDGVLWEKWSMSVCRTCNGDRVYCIYFFYNYYILLESDIEDYKEGRILFSDEARPLRCLASLFSDFPVVRLRRSLADLAHSETAHVLGLEINHSFDDDVYQYDL